MTTRPGPVRSVSREMRSIMRTIFAFSSCTVVCRLSPGGPFVSRGISVLTRLVRLTCRTLPCRELGVLTPLSQKVYIDSVFFFPPHPYYSL